jgi:hypothetical protein
VNQPPAQFGSRNAVVSAAVMTNDQFWARNAVVSAAVIENVRLGPNQNQFATDRAMTDSHRQLEQFATPTSYQA